MSIISSVPQRRMQRHNNLIDPASRSIQWKRLRNLALIGTCFLILTACSVAPNHSGPDLGIGDAVKTVPIEPGAASNDHPVKISPQVLASLLNGLVMRQPPEDDDFLDHLDNPSANQFL